MKESQNIYSVVEHLGYATKDKQQRKIGEITQLQFLDLQDEIEDALTEIDQDMVILQNDHLQKIKLIDEKTNELLLECTIGDKYHQLLLEVGLNTILEKFVK